MQGTDLAVDPPEAGRRLGVGRTTIYKLIRSGDLPIVKIGRLTRIPVAALDEFIALRTHRQAV
jgi:excisionase family DNA binding protein